MRAWYALSNTLFMWFFLWCYFGAYNIDFYSLIELKISIIVDVALYILYFM